MNSDKHKNMAMVTITAVVLLLANLGIWMATQKGMIAPVANKAVWGGFVALNMASILWAVTLLGLQPMVVAVSYVAGGFLAFKGVQGMGGISVAEVTTAGATYGAFGALAVGNATAKVRLAFYNKKQVPFLFIIVALLVFDAALNSGVSSAGGNVILNAVVFPFVLAGVIVGMVWSLLIRFGIGRNPGPAKLHLEQHASEEAAAVVEEAEEDNMLKFQVPDDVAEEEPIVLAETVAEQVEEPETEPAPVAQAAMEAAPVIEEMDEDFFPLEIDKDDDFVLPQEEHALDLDEAHSNDPFSMPNFDSTLYASGAVEDASGDVEIDDPLTAIALDLDEEHASESISVEPEIAVEAAPIEQPVEPEIAMELKPAEQEVEPEVALEPESVELPRETEQEAIEQHVAVEAEVVEQKPATEPEASVETTVEEKAPQPKPAGKSQDWLSGHLDLLSKLK